MRKAGIVATVSTASIFAATSALGQFTELETSPGISDKIDQAVIDACPDPTPASNSISAIMGYKTCIDGTVQGISSIAADVSTYITDSQVNLFTLFADNKRLLQCVSQVVDTYISDKDFDPTVSNLESYGNDRINVIRYCIDKIATVQDNTGHWYNQEGQNAVINQVNCFLTPETCIRPEKPKAEPAPVI